MARSALLPRAGDGLDPIVVQIDPPNQMILGIGDIEDGIGGAIPREH